MFCTDDMYRCKNGQCIDISLVCDFMSHCADGTDEYCGKYDVLFSTVCTQALFT